jgi:predicted component of viral defense system (DUF524 family)
MTKKNAHQLAHKDPIVDEIRRNRSELWTEYQGDLVAFSSHAQTLMKKLGMKTASRKPVAESLDDLAKKKKAKKDAA